MLKVSTKIQENNALSYDDAIMMMNEICSTMKFAGNEYLGYCVGDRLIDIDDDGGTPLFSYDFQNKYDSIESMIKSLPSEPTLKSLLSCVIIWKQTRLSTQEK